MLDPACGDGALLLAALEALGGGPAAARRLVGLEIDPELARRARGRLARAAGLSPAEFEGRVTVADALDRETAWPGGAAILANPPWLSFSGRHAAQAGKRTAPASGGGWPSLQGAFLVRIARHCGTEGVPARLLLPSSVLELEGYAPAREAAGRNAHPACPPEELGERAFAGVLEPSVLLTLAPGPCRADSSWSATAVSSELLDELEGRPKLPPATFTDVGVHTGNSSSELVRVGTTPGWAPMRRGADLQAYHLNEASLSLRLDLERGPERRFRIADPGVYRAFPALVRQTADRPIAAPHTRPTYFRNSLLGVRDVPGLDPAFVVALLNSSVAAHWHRARFCDARQRAFPQVKVGHLRTLPTPITCRDEDPRLHDEVVRAVRDLRAGDAEHDEGVRWIEERVLEGFCLPHSLRRELVCDRR